MQQEGSRTIVRDVRAHQFYNFDPHPGYKYRYDYESIAEDLLRCRIDKNERGMIEIVRSLSEVDMFFFAYFVLGLPVNDPFIADRGYEVQDDHSWVLDIWARGHFKSTWNTFTLPIWKVIKNPERRIGIFSHTRALAKSHLIRIKNELEVNAILKRCWPDIFYENPKNDSRHSTEAIRVKRSGSYTDETIEAWGNDNLPTGKHFTDIIFDDVVNDASVSSRDQREKTQHAFGQAFNLVDEEYTPHVIGTYYHYHDLYTILKRQGDWKVREHAGTEDGTEDGEPVYWTRKEMQLKRRSMGKYIFSCQILLKPVPEEDQVFLVDWLSYFDKMQGQMNLYLVADPSGGLFHDKTGDEPDFTVMMVVGVDAFHNKYVVDMVRDRLNLKQRWETYRDLMLKWNPRASGYEKFSMQADIEYFREKSQIEGVQIKMPEPLGSTAKAENKDIRIRSLVPQFEDSKIWLPEKLTYRQKDGKEVDLIQSFIDEEYLEYPKGAHDDMLDCLSRINDEKLAVTYPKSPYQKEMEKKSNFFTRMDSRIRNKVAKDWRTW